MGVEMLKVEQRIMERVSKSNSSGCWVWTGGKNSHGYGYINIGGSMKRVHKALWEIYHPKVPAKMHLDHLCRNRACCNPGHLEVVTHAENLRRGNRGGNGYEKKTHCPQGHEYSGENTYRAKDGSRMCRECLRARLRTPERRAYERARYAAKKERSGVI